MEEKGELRPSRRMASAADVKLAAVALALNVRLRSADMPAAMQERAFRSARALLDELDFTSQPNPTSIAMALKKEFDASYGPAWHCVVGKSFGSFTTHSPGGFLYFSLDRLSFLLFKTQVTPVVRSPPIADVAENNPASRSPHLPHYS